MVDMRIVLSHTSKMTENHKWWYNCHPPSARFMLNVKRRLRKLHEGDSFTTADLLSVDASWHKLKDAKATADELARYRATKRRTGR